MPFYDTRPLMQLNLHSASKQFLPSIPRAHLNAPCCFLPTQRPVFLSRQLDARFGRRDPCCLCDMIKQHIQRLRSNSISLHGQICLFLDRHFSPASLFSYFGLFFSTLLRANIPMRERPVKLCLVQGLSSITKSSSRPLPR